ILTNIPGGGASVDEANARLGEDLVSVREVVESDESFVIQGWRPDSRRSRRCGRPKTAQNIPRSRQYPKILWIDDAEVVGDGITKASPVLGDFVAQEIERDVREL